MDTVQITFRGKGVEEDCHYVAIWLRLMALNLPDDMEPLVALSHRWLRDSIYTQYSAPSLDEIDGHIEAIEVVLKTAATLIAKIEEVGSTFHDLHLLGIRPDSCGPGTLTAPIVKLGKKFEHLICQHTDLIEQIFARHIFVKPRLGPPCPYCGINLRHPKGQQCIDCGWDWHDLQNPVQRKTNTNTKPEPDPKSGKNPFSAFGRFTPSVKVS